VFWRIVKAGLAKIGHKYKEEKRKFGKLWLPPFPGCAKLYRGLF